MKKTKLFVNGMFDLSALFAQPHIPYLFALLLVVIVSVVLVIFDYCDVSPQAYSALIAAFPLAAGIINHLQNSQK